MPTTCSFAFDRPDATYYSGETISGRATLHTTSENTVRGIYIIFKGAASVHWEETYTISDGYGKREDHTKYFRGDETYLNTQTRMYGDGILPPGTHVYPFNIPLPLKCPTSCTEKLGEICYEISLKVGRPSSFDNIFTQSLTVIRQLDLNNFPEYLIPIKGEKVQHFCCWPCSSGPVISTLTIPFGGWAPGQKIPFKLEIDNQSAGYDLKGTELKLNQTYKFQTQSPNYQTRRLHNIVARLRDDDRTILRFSKRVFEGKLRIPQVPPTFLNGIIAVSYQLEMYIRACKNYSDSAIIIPITIGSIPLAQAMPAPTPDTPKSSDKPPSYDSIYYNAPTCEDATLIV